MFEVGRKKWSVKLKSLKRKIVFKRKKKRKNRKEENEKE
jgi:hypothetical protein